MIALPEGISRDDIGQWLYGGICLARPSSQEPFVAAVMDRTMTGPNDRPSALSVRLITDGFEDSRIVAIEDVRAHWPMCGSVNVQDRRVAVHVERLPARQYKRTYNSRQVSIRVPRAWDVRRRIGENGLREVRSQTVPLLRALFDPTYPKNVGEAFDMLSDGWLSVALNPRIIVAGDDVGKRMVYYRGKLAATMTGGVLSPVADETTCGLINRAFGGRYPWI